MEDSDNCQLTGRRMCVMLRANLLVDQRHVVGTGCLRLADPASYMLQLVFDTQGGSPHLLVTFHRSVNPSRAAQCLSHFHAPGKTSHKN